MLMILPCPCATMRAPAARHRRNTAVRLISSTSSQSRSSWSVAGARRMIPALFTRMSTLPIASTASVTRRIDSARSDRSATMHFVRTRVFSRMARSVSPAQHRPCSTTSAPASASAVAIAAPRPRDDPVTSATSPSSRKISVFIEVLPPCPGSWTLPWPVGDRPVAPTVFRRLSSLVPDPWPPDPLLLRLARLEPRLHRSNLGLDVDDPELTVHGLALGRHHPEEADGTPRRRHVRMIAAGHQHDVAFVNDGRQFRLRGVGVDQLDAECRRGHGHVEVRLLEHLRVLMWRPGCPVARLAEGDAGHDPPGLDVLGEQ